MALIKFPNGKEIRLDCSDSEQELIQSQVDALSARADSAETVNNKFNQFFATHFDEDNAEKKLDELGEKIKDMKKNGENTDELQAKYDEMKEQVEKSKSKMDSDELGQIFDTYEKAVKLNPEIKIRKDSGEVKSMRELVIEAMPEVKMDGKSDEYALARLDTAIEYAGDSFVKQQRQDSLESKGGKSKLTAQQRADAKFYGTLKEGDK